jgi:cell division protease FtsH
LEVHDEEEDDASSWNSDNLLDTTERVFTLLFMGFTVATGIVIFNSIRNGGGAGGGKNGLGSFLKDRNYEIKTEVSTRFSDVAGHDAAKEELREVVEFLKNPERFEKLGAKVPRGCLLTGGPGLGKTLLARAVAGEAGVPFLTVSSPEFIEMFVGVGAKRIRDLFDQARSRAPCIIFMDEIDAIGKIRGRGNQGASDENDQTINQLLTEMDGFDHEKGSNPPIIVLAATNRADVLDSALLRPGRFDRRIELEMPTKKSRAEILKVHAVGKPISPEVDLTKVAADTTGFTGAELSNLLNEAAISAVRRGASEIENVDFDIAYDRIVVGLDRKDVIPPADQKRIVAYHEAGHAIVATLLSKEGEYDKVRKVTILPRGKAGGFTSFQNEDSSVSLRSRQFLENDLAVALGGRVAEQIVSGDAYVTTGSSADLQYVQNLARTMVCVFGFREIELDPISWPPSNGDAYFYSESTMKEIDEEIRRIAQKAHRRAKMMLESNIKGLRAVALELEKNETLTGDEVSAILNSARVI